MHGPGGVDHENKSVFVEVAKPERIVFQHVSRPQFQVTATFAEQGGKTRLTFQMLFETSNERNFDRLEAQLARTARHPAR